MSPKTRRNLILVAAAVLLVIALAVLIVALTADDDEDDDEALTVTGAWVRATAAGSAEEASSGLVTGAFMVIHNADDDADRLVAAAVAPDLTETVEIHETTLGANDVMQMRPVDGVEVPAGDSVELMPGSYHLMLIDLKRPLAPGDSVPITLTFESGATLNITAEVRAMDTMPGMGE